MRHPRSDAHAPSTQPMLRWVFRRHADTITCELDVSSARSYDVCVVPHWNVASSLVERFDGAASAIMRHAEIARSLRDSGWLLTEYESAHRVPAAA